MDAAGARRPSGGRAFIPASRLPGPGDERVGGRKRARLVIARRGRRLVFCEVKAKLGGGYGDPNGDGSGREAAPSGVRRRPGSPIIPSSQGSRCGSTSWGSRRVGGSASPTPLNLPREASCCLDLGALPLGGVYFRGGRRSSARYAAANGSRSPPDEARQSSCAVRCSFDRDLDGEPELRLCGVPADGQLPGEGRGLFFFLNFSWHHRSRSGNRRSPARRTPERSRALGALRRHRSRPLVAAGSAGTRADEARPPPPSVPRQVHPAARRDAAARYVPVAGACSIPSPARDDARPGARERATTRSASTWQRSIACSWR